MVILIYEGALHCLVEISLCSSPEGTERDCAVTEDAYVCVDHIPLEIASHEAVEYLLVHGLRQEIR